MSAALVLGAALAALAFALARLLIGPTLLDRAAAAHALMALGAVLAAAIAAAANAPHWLDVAFGVVAGQIVLAVAVLKAARRRSFQPPLAGLNAPATRPAPAKAGAP